MIKKITPLLMLMLAGCVYAGEIDVLKSRKGFFTFWNSYSVDRYKNEQELVKTEYLNDKNYKLNQSMTAFRGYSVLNDRTYRRYWYQQNFVKPNQNGALSSGGISQTYKKDDKINVLGAFYMDGKKWRLIPGESDEFVFMIDDEGNFGQRSGKLDGSRLILLGTEYEVMPSTLKMVDIATSSSTQTKPVKGFDVKYEGIKNDRLWFTVFDYSSAQDGGRGTFEEISFPNKPGLIEINGIGFRVLKADNQRLDYMVIRD